jgi:hypothetical protein
MAKAAGCADIRVSSNELLSFGKWGGVLASMVRDSKPAGWCSIYFGELADPVIEVLASIADVVVR